MWGSPLLADIVSSVSAISITFSQPGALQRLGLQIPCEQLDWQLSCISQICDHFSAFLSSVEDIGIKTMGPSSVPDDMYDEQWLGLIRAFDCAKNFRVAGGLAADIFRVLRPANEEHETVLPSLRDLHVQEPIPVVHFPGSSSIPIQFAGAIPIRRPVTEEVAFAKRWVEEQKKIAFNYSFEGFVGSPIPDSEIPEYIRNLERLDMALVNIERYIHIAFAALKKEDVVRRMFTMMASTKFQLEECKKPNPRYVLELRTIRGMIEEADNMDKGLRTVLGLQFAAKGNAPAPHPQQTLPVGPAPSFVQPTIGTQG
ncbi:hypothetical protein EDB87DRAFT_1628559 [Lactarius vividus]|nr:hypothetical protein EDB87DRAFT_1628559 [Lactarius vividus]